MEALKHTLGGLLLPNFAGDKLCAKKKLVSFLKHSRKMCVEFLVTNTSRVKSLRYYFCLQPTPLPIPRDHPLRWRGQLLRGRWAVVAAAPEHSAAGEPQVCQRSGRGNPTAELKKVGRRPILRSIISCVSGLSEAFHGPVRPITYHEYDCCPIVTKELCWEVSKITAGTVYAFK